MLMSWDGVAPGLSNWAFRGYNCYSKTHSVAVTILPVQCPIVWLGGRVEHEYSSCVRVSGNV